MAKPNIGELVAAAIDDVERPMILARYTSDEAVYVNARTKVKLGCERHGAFEILPRDIERRNYLCSACRDEFKADARDGHRTALVAKIEAQFPGTFDYSELVYKDTQTPVTVICLKHQTRHDLYPFDLDKNTYKRTYICTDCRDEGLRERFSSSSEAFVEKAKAVHGDRYEYHKVDYQNASTKVVIGCASHGDFEQAPRSHLSGRGCPKCARLSMAEAKRKPPANPVDHK